MPSDIDTVNFNGRVFLLGCGGVAQCTLPLLLDLVPGLKPQNVTVFDMVDNRARIQQSLRRGVKYVVGRITQDNYETVLAEYLSSGDLFIDLAWNIRSSDLLEWCHRNNVLYINTSVEEWEPYEDFVDRSPTALTLYDRQMRLRAMTAAWGDKNGPTAVVDHGANPGLVSHFVKQALIEIAEKILDEKDPSPERRAALEAALQARDWKKLAFHTGVKTIHISERDTQISCRPKEPNEFVNTWSVAGFIEEGMAPAEMGWGTHEKSMPPGAMEHIEGPRNQICLASKGVNTLVRSWVPSGPIIGMVVRHGEAFSISDYLTVWTEDSTPIAPDAAAGGAGARASDGRIALYRPTVHYAYLPCDGAVASMHELQMRGWEEQEHQRVLNDDIISGKDELGCLLMGHDFGAWWIGSVLDIHEARRLVPNQNATTVQVAISVVSSALWAIMNPDRGLCLPDDVDHEFVLGLSKPYLGTFVSQVADFDPLKMSERNLYLQYGRHPPAQEDKWQFNTLLVRHNNYSEPGM